jgi:hypothetical protein
MRILIWVALSFNATLAQTNTLSGDALTLARIEASRILPEELWLNGNYSRDVLRDMPVERISDIVKYVESHRAIRIGGVKFVPGERTAIDLLAEKLEQHRMELAPSGSPPNPIYLLGINALVQSLDELLGNDEYFNSRELANLQDDRVQRILRAALNRNIEKGKLEAPREEARERVWIRLQEANQGEDPHELPADFDRQVDAELAKMVAAGEVASYQPTMTALPIPPQPDFRPHQSKLADSSVQRPANASILLQNWSAWHTTALAALVGATGWAIWRVFKK